MSLEVIREDNKKEREDNFERDFTKRDEFQNVWRIVLNPVEKYPILHVLYWKKSLSNWVPLMNFNMQSLSPAEHSSNHFCRWQTTECS